MIQLGIDAKAVQQWKLKNFDFRVSQHLCRENSSKYARIVWVADQKYQVKMPLREVNHVDGKGYSSSKDQYRDSYGMHKARALLKVSELEEVLIEEV